MTLSIIIIIVLYAVTVSFFSNGELEIVTMLVTAGQADVNCKDNDGQTPLHKAC